jgi:acetoin utilization protein AcuB
MTVDGIMTREVVTVAPDTALSEVRAHLHEGGFRHLLVVEEGALIGVISDRDVLRALSPFLDTYSEEHRDVRTLARPAREIMRAEPVTVAPGTDVEEAASLVLDHKISSLPVVEGNEIVGIVTTKDLLRHYTKEG